MRKLRTISSLITFVSTLCGGVWISTFFTGCQSALETPPLFEALSADHTRIDFENTLAYTNEFNIYKYRNYYNGGGVGLGDVNDDGLLDIYFTANLLSNRLYLNRGNFVFEDVTEAAQVGGSRAWSTGVSMVDINADGWLDIYVCNSGDVAGDNKQNELFINQGDGTFVERAEEMGLADTGFSTHATFFDYDKDGDLDVYLLNNSYTSINRFNLRQNQRHVRDSLGGDKLYRNDLSLPGGQFTDVSEAANIYGSEIGFGLGVAAADLNRDGWMDLYVCNDFFERDYLYMNNGDGTFREELETKMRSIGVASMGADVADLTGDGYPEVFVTEMLPEDDQRFKTTMTFENWDKYQHNLKNDYHHQFTRNVLHRHNGLQSDSNFTFSEIGRLAGVEATDWSWSALLTDLDNDGYPDLYITNGLAQDILDQDYLNYVANEEVARMVVKDEGVDYKQLIDIIPVNRIPNYAYAGGSAWPLRNQTEAWGLAEPSHSNGAAYGDLDNDGDLDLVVNNASMPPFVYRNRSEEVLPEHHYLTVTLAGKGGNTYAVGAQLTVRVGGRTLYREQSPQRGFQSSVDPRLHFGLGVNEQIDTLTVDWYNGGRTVMTNVAADQTLTLREEEAIAPIWKPSIPTPPLFTNVTPRINLDFTHRENPFVDFDRDRLLYHMKSTEGPRVAVGDVNGDGLDDFYIGGAKDTSGALFVQTSSGTYQSTNETVWEADKGSEDATALFFDADGDQDLDLYVASGGTEFSTSSFALVDRLYFNDGSGQFTKSTQILPSGKPVSTSVVTANDIDADGDQDLFVGGRLQPGLYGVPQDGYILQNDGRGTFTDVTTAVAPALRELGMLTDAVWSDYDADGDQDLLVVGEWMMIKLFNNQEGRWEEVTEAAGLARTAGWWNRLAAADLDGDGDTDFVAGNHGLNSRFRASEAEPITCYVNDFDQNGTVEQLVSVYNEGLAYPPVLRHDLVAQLPSLKKKYLKYHDYQGQTVQDIFPADVLERSVIHQVTMLESVALLNQGDGTFAVHPLPTEAQLAPMYAILPKDINGDGHLDVIMGGNLHGVKPEAGRYDASEGVYLRGNGDGTFVSVPPAQSGLLLAGEVRDIVPVNIARRQTLLVARNNNPVQFFHYE